MTVRRSCGFKVTDLDDPTSVFEKTVQTEGCILVSDGKGNTAMKGPSPLPERQLFAVS